MSDWDDFVFGSVFTSVEIQGKLVDRSGNDFDIRPHCRLLAAIASSIEIRENLLKDFVLTEKRVLPPLVIHAHLDPDAYVHLRTKKIYFNLGMLLSLDSLGHFLDRLRATMNKKITIEELSAEKPTNGMLNEIHRMFAYWSESRKRKDRALIVPGGNDVSFQIS